MNGSPHGFPRAVCRFCAPNVDAVHIYYENVFVDIFIVDRSILLIIMVYIKYNKTMKKLFSIFSVFAVSSSLAVADDVYGVNITSDFDPSGATATYSDAADNVWGAYSRYTGGISKISGAYSATALNGKAYGLDVYNVSVTSVSGKYTAVVAATSGSLDSTGLYYSSVGKFGNLDITSQNASAGTAYGMSTFSFSTPGAIDAANVRAENVGSAGGAAIAFEVIADKIETINASNFIASSKSGIAVGVRTYSLTAGAETSLTLSGTNNIVGRGSDKSTSYSVYASSYPGLSRKSFSIVGDSSMNAFTGKIYADCELTFDANLALYIEDDWQVGDTFNAIEAASIVFSAEREKNFSLTLLGRDGSAFAGTWDTQWLTDADGNRTALQVAVTAIPEPSSCAAIFAVFAIALVALRRRK